jgi:hypothetical protein
MFPFHLKCVQIFFYIHVLLSSYLYWTKSKKRILTQVFLRDWLRCSSDKVGEVMTVMPSNRCSIATCMQQKPAGNGIADPHRKKEKK